MISASIRFLDFMDRRPLPGGQAVFRLNVVPRYVAVIRPENDTRLPIGPARSPSLARRMGLREPLTKPKRVLVPRFDLARVVELRRTTDEDGRATGNFEVDELFVELAELRFDGELPLDVVAFLDIAFEFMGSVRTEQRLDEPFMSANASKLLDVPVDFGHAGVGHTDSTHTRLWFALADEPSRDRTYHCVIAPTTRGPREDGTLRPLGPEGGEQLREERVEIQQLDGTGLVDFDELEPGRRYQYELRVSHEGRSFPILLGALETPELDADDHLAFSFGSCHLPTVPVDLEQAREAADRQLDRWRHLQRRDDDELLLLIGDQIYGDGIQRKWPNQHWFERYQRRYRQLWAYWPMRAVLRRTPTYMILDDHEVTNNLGTAELDPVRRQAALDVYRRFQHARNPGGPDGPLHYSFRRGPAAFFVADCRTHRTPGRGGILGHQQLEDMRAWAASPSTRAADVIFMVLSVPPALLPTELVRKIALQAIEDGGEAFGAGVGALVGAGVGGLFGGVVGAAVGGLVLGAVGHEIGEETVERNLDDLDRSLLVSTDLADRWDVKRNQPDMVAVLDLLFDLANGVDEDEPRRRAVFVLGGDIHTGTMHLIRSLPIGRGRRHRANPVAMQLTSSAISIKPLDQVGYRELVSRVDDDFDLRLRDFSVGSLWDLVRELPDLDEAKDEAEQVVRDKLDELLGDDPAAYTLDSELERRYRTEFAGLLMDHNVGRVRIDRIGPGRRYHFHLAIEGVDESLIQDIEMDLESDADEVPRFSLRDPSITRIYLQVVREAEGDRVEPLAGVRVRVMDQDEPAPARDDVTPPEDDTRVTTTPKLVTRVTTRYEPNEDQELASARTDRFGVAWLKLSEADRRTSAGEVTTTRSTEVLGTFPGGPRPRPEPFGPLSHIPRPGSESKTSRHTTRRALLEERPDIYFLLTLPDGRVVDTRELDDGMFVNVRGGSLGSAERPLRFTVKRERDTRQDPKQDPKHTSEPGGNGRGRSHTPPPSQDRSDPREPGEGEDQPDIDLPPKVVIDRPKIDPGPVGPGPFVPF